MNGPELYCPFPLISTDDANTGLPPQVASSGPKTVKPIDPVGLEPPDKVAMSEIAPPKMTDVEAWVLREGAVVTTVTKAESLLFSGFGSPDDDTEAMLSYSVPAGAPAGM